MIDKLQSSGGGSHSVKFTADFDYDSVPSSLGDRPGRFQAAQVQHIRRHNEHCIEDGIDIEARFVVRLPPLIRLVTECQRAVVTTWDRS